MVSDDLYRGVGAPVVQLETDSKIVAKANILNELINLFISYKNDHERE